MRKKAKQKSINLELKQLSLMSKSLIYISLLSCVLMGAYFMLQEQMKKFPITAVKIHGQIIRTAKQEIWGSMSASLKQGFFGTDVAAIRANLKKLPWIETVKVEKIWPDKLAITVNEKTPIARWRGKGLVTTSGDIVYTELLNDADNLPMFWGNENQTKQMLASYLLMTDILKLSDIGVAEIEIMPDQGLRAILSNGIMLFLGQEGLPERLNRFTLAYRNKLQKMSHKIDYVDLRYVNGIAVGWKDSISKIYLEHIFLDEGYKVNA